MTPTLCSIPEAARTLGVSQERVRQYVREGRLAADRVGPVYVIQASALAGFTRRPPGRPCAVKVMREAVSVAPVAPVSVAPVVSDGEARARARGFVPWVCRGMSCAACSATQCGWRGASRITITPAQPILESERAAHVKSVAAYTRSIARIVPLKPHFSDTPTMRAWDSWAASYRARQA